MLQALLNDLLGVQLTVAKEMPDDGTPLKEALDTLDYWVDYLEGYLEAKGESNNDNSHRDKRS